MRFFSGTYMYRIDLLRPHQFEIVLNFMAFRRIFQLASSNI